MITWFRDLLAGPFKWVFLGLVVVAFAAFGDFDLSRFTAQDALKVGERGYTGPEIDRVFTRRFSTLQQQDPSLTKAGAASSGLLEQVVTELQVQALFSEEADRLGLTATDDMVQQYLRDSGAFNGPDGEFSPRLVELVIQQNRITPTEFRDDLRAEIVRDQLVSALAVPSRAPASLTELLILRAGEQRSVLTATVNAAAAPDPTDDEIRSYYAANAEAYSAPEVRTYRALIVDAAAVEDRVDVTEADVRQYFEAERARLAEPERRTYRQALFPTAEAAQAAADRVSAGEPLRAVAEEVGASTTRAADATKADILDQAVAAAIFEKPEPGVVGPVEGTFGSVVAEVETITPGRDIAFEEVEDDLRERRRGEVVRQQLFAAVEEVEVAFDEGSSLAEAAAAAGLSAPRQFGPVDADLFTPEGAIEAVPGAVHRTAFSLSEGDESEAVTLDDGGYAFVVVDSVRPAETRPFETVADRVRTDFLADRASGALQAAMADFQAAVAGGQTFEEAAAAIGSDVGSATISARRPDPAIPQSMLLSVFEAEMGDVVAEAAPTGDTGVVAMVQSVSFEAIPNLDALIGDYRDQIGEQMTGELLNAYVAALEGEFGVERNDAVIAQALGLTE